MILVRKFLVGCRVIHTHTHNLSAQRCQRVQIIAKLTRFLRATWGVIFRIEVKHNPSATHLLKSPWFAVLIG